MDPVEKEQILQYARYHGLTNDKPSTDISDASFKLCPPGDISLDVLDPEAAPTLESLAAFDEIERLDLFADARGLFHSVLVKDAALPKDHWQQYHKMPKKQLKLETPLLSTDHDLDVRRFRRGMFIDLSERVQYPLVLLDEEADEGLNWPTELQTLPEKLDADAQNEKLDMTRDTLRYLKSVITAENDEASVGKAIEDDLTYKRVQLTLLHREVY